MTYVAASTLPCAGQPLATASQRLKTAPYEPDLYSLRHKKWFDLRKSEISSGTTFYAAPNGAGRL
jgi:hypothetical protein